MIRSVGIVLIILGLIAQPLVTAMPMSMADDSSHSPVVVDSGAMGHHSDQGAEELAKAPCHESATDSASSESCDNCDMDCMNGICASSCLIGGAVAFQKQLVNIDLLSSTTVAASSGARAYGLPSRIFHPPKQV
jgi:hypothetical protein